MSIQLPKLSTVLYTTTSGSQFDGTNDYMSKAAAVISGYDTGVCSFWIKKNVANNVGQIVSCIDSAGSPSPGNILSIDINNNTFTVLVRVSGDTSNRRIRTTSSGLNNTNWNHVCFGWSHSGGTCSLAINGVSIAVTFTLVSGLTTCTTPTNWYFGSDETAGNKLAADVSEFYLDDGLYLDCSTKAVIRKFYSEIKRPVFLGSTGIKPKGTVPKIYFKGVGTGFNINSGSGGDFTTTGTLTTSSSTPST